MLVAAAAFGVWGTFATVRAQGESERSARVAASYAAARAALLAERTAARRYASNPTPSRREALRRSSTRVARAYRAVARAGVERDRLLTQRLTLLHARYVDRVRGLADASRGADGYTVRSLRARGVDSLFRTAETKTNRALAAARRRVLAGLDDQRRVERFAAATLPITSALAVLLASLFAAPFGPRRRREDARRARYKLLERAALTDSLTGLGNHRAFHEALKRLIEQRSRSRSASWFSVIALDLDGLKEINDTFGHQAGDDVIRALGDLLRDTIRAGDSAYRVGGDEFMVILPGERAWGAFTLAQRLQVGAATRTRKVSVAAGIGETVDLESKDTVIRRADLALYEAKRSNRKTVVYSPALEPMPATRDRQGERRHLKVLATALARAVDAKDASTRTHCETVSELCVLIAHQLELEPERVARLRVAGLLHDVGKIGITDAILLKEGPLGEDECDVMRTHPVIGDNIVAAANLVDEARWILHHHERFDGGGYPDGLRGDEIPLESRIILVADAFEAIVADRPYREGRSPGEALDELERHAGTQFDPNCVRALRQVVLGGADEQLEKLVAA